MTASDEWLTIESIDLEAQGVAHNDEGKVVFVDGALPGEQVRVNVQRRKNQWERAEMVELRHESPLRVKPRCPHFGLHAGACGGCKMQHVDAAAQVAFKQRALEDALAHLGKLKPRRMLRPLEGPAWGYRWRARLSVRYVARKGRVLIGFHERKSSYVADMRECHVLPSHLSAMLQPLSALIASMQARDRLPQIEVAIGEDDAGLVTALVLRHLEPLEGADRQRLRDFAQAHGVQWWLQPKGPESIGRLDGEASALAYRLPEFDLRLPFRPTDFTQVNHAINRVLVGQALRLLDAGPGERVIDWFCGLGNFTLPIARRASEVLGLEGSSALVARAREAAATNGLAATARFEAVDLFELTPEVVRGYGGAQKWLIDPPREGAFALAKALAEHEEAGSAASSWRPPARIVYVSCNPATLARDAGLLVHRAGYRCEAAGVVNMFPHTAHVESIAVFERDPV
ncbi:MAG TPA: 23S rRNA (uracil(1939)-C(5))-methyltransferase RlmD [Methylibium sp.]|uniref:23S rRNA (uracil(1939)-C(5))-methyltransferase RlmD n=1 Tax=Methylibium sp. TaxID=2067992 RepID=UPI002DB7288A|nr:23S rRNA (uracil(1939)-C(5))-methyltransferase RlmD [Methylibium sp.]HEU4459063.1 23S rRNA (uracil(1939)-C(5))-methyltransferase RlmD [Methylibium sp.]